MLCSAVCFAFCCAAQRCSVMWYCAMWLGVVQCAVVWYSVVLLLYWGLSILQQFSFGELYGALMSTDAGIEMCL